MNKEVALKTKETSMTITAREAFERGTETFNAHDIDGFAEVLPDDVVFEAPGGLRGQGKAACIEFYGNWFGAFRDAHVEVHCLHIIGDVAVEEGTFTGTHNGVLKGPTGEVPPTGRPVRIAYIQVLRFRDGKHISFNLMFDRLSMLEQLGLVPAPLPRAG
jgi:ketosteroid isomerase-like protein